MLLKCLCLLLLVRAKQACDLCKNTWILVFIITLQNSIKVTLPAVAALQNKIKKISILYKWLVTAEKTCLLNLPFVDSINKPLSPILPQPKLKHDLHSKTQAEWNMALNSSTGILKVARGFHCVPWPCSCFWPVLSAVSCQAVLGTRGYPHLCMEVSAGTKREWASDFWPVSSMRWDFNVENQHSLFGLWACPPSRSWETGVIDPYPPHPKSSNHPRSADRLLPST